MRHQRADGSHYDDEQLRYRGKFITERSVLTLSDVEVLARSGYSKQEAQRASNQLNIDIQKKIDSGESESNVMREMRQVYDMRENKFIDAPV